MINYLCFLVGVHDLTKNLGESIGLRLQNAANENRLILTHLTTFSLEGIKGVGRGGSDGSDEPPFQFQNFESINPTKYNQP